MEMERTEKDLKVIEKVKFYFSENIKAHVLTVPAPEFKNGLFVSELITSKNGTGYFWFIENDSAIPIRLFLYEIHDIEDYRNKEGGE